MAPREPGPKPGGQESLAGSRLPYARHLDDFTLVLRDGALLQAVGLDGLLFETQESDQLNYRKVLRDGVLRSLATSRHALYHHIVRREVQPGLPGRFPDAFSADLDAIWRRRLASRRLYINDLFVSVVRRPPPMAGWQGVLRGLGGGEASGVEAVRMRGDINAAVEQLAAGLEPYGVRRLGAYDGPRGPGSELLEMLALLYDGAAAPVLMPFGDLGLHLPRRRVSFGLNALELAGGADRGRTFAAIVSIKDYPDHTGPGLLDELLRLPHEMVVTQSFAFLDRQPALDRMNLAMRRMRAADEDAFSLRDELIFAKDEVAAGRAAYGEHHMSVLVRSATLELLGQAVAEVQSVLSDIGAISVREDINLEAAFWAQFPGNNRFIARRATISTTNFAGFASAHNFAVGRAEGNHWGSAVSVLETTAAGPYHFNFHSGDLGNFTLIGPSGSGKTVVLNFLLSQAQRFAPRTVFFDKDRGAEIFLRAMGGRYDVLRPGRPTGFNPLRLEASPENRRFLIEWTCRLAGGAVSAQDLAEVDRAVNANFLQPPAYRRLRYFAELFRGGRRPMPDDFASRLEPWWGGGDRAWVFDNEEDGLDLGVQTIGFDITHILDDADVRTPVLMYLFQRIEERLDGHPSLIAIDEGWKALDDPVFALRLKDWLKTIRKRNGVVGFVTQSAADALESRVAHAIVEQAATQVFMPNPRARREDYCAGFGLTDHEFELVRGLPDTSRCFLVKRAQESVVARLDLGGEPRTLAVLSGRQSSVDRLDKLRAEHGDHPDLWLAQLLEDA